MIDLNLVTFFVLPDANKDVRAKCEAEQRPYEEVCLRSWVNCNFITILSQKHAYHHLSCTAAEVLRGASPKEEGPDRHVHHVMPVPNPFPNSCTLVDLHFFYLEGEVCTYSYFLRGSGLGKNRISLGPRLPLPADHLPR